MFSLHSDIEPNRDLWHHDRQINDTKEKLLCSYQSPWMYMKPAMKILEPSMILMLHRQPITVGCSVIYKKRLK